MDFSFATPILGAKSVATGSKVFGQWLDKTEGTYQSPSLVVKAGHACREGDVRLLDQSDRYEGHTADLLFTRWLENTEAALSPEPQTSSALQTPVSGPWYNSALGTPAAGLTTTQGQPHSALRAACAAACRGTSDSNAPTPLTRCDFGTWRAQHLDGTDTESSYSDPGEDISVVQGLTVSGATPSDLQRQFELEGNPASDYDLVAQLADMQMSAPRPSRPAGSTWQQAEDMQVSPMPSGLMLDPQSPWNKTPKTPTEEQVLALMLSPAPAEAAGRDAGLAALGPPLPLHWGDSEQVTGSTAQDLTAATAAGGEEQQPWGQGEAGWESSDDEVDPAELEGLTYTPLSCTMTPVEELIGLMLTPGEPVHLDFD